MQIDTSTLVQGELMDSPPPPRPRVFDLLQYFETPLILFTG